MKAWSDTVYLTPEEWGQTTYLIDEKDIEAVAESMRSGGSDFADCSTADLGESGQILRGKEARAIRRKLEISGRAMVAVSDAYQKRNSRTVRLYDCYEVTRNADPEYLGRVEQ
jgi:hypothetical protein